MRERYIETLKILVARNDEVEADIEKLGHIGVPEPEVFASWYSEAASVGVHELLARLPEVELDVLRRDLIVMLEKSWIVAFNGDWFEGDIHATDDGWTGIIQRETKVLICGIGYEGRCPLQMLLQEQRDDDALTA